MLKAIIIDDEPACCKTLSTLLDRFCTGVNVIATCHDGEEGVSAIHEYSPDIVFLDIEMPKMNGFDMLEQLPKVNFHLIFTTSYDQYALKAFRFSAIDYLLKPIDREELQKAVQKVNRTLQFPLQQQLEILMQCMNNPLKPLNKIALPTMQGLELINVDSIISCESDDNYTILKLKNKTKLVVSCTLKEIEEMLSNYSFARIHRSHMVNLNEVEKYIRGEGGYLLMSDGTAIDVSRSKKETLLKRLLPDR